ncbi:hypothetical protein VPNG_07695 [Cytospora leucostoma]|uniref:Major facilitator superfamily (MFS) profile domain-containing protein n=1 Tax=Cytospora leucostoma TaxID=1230097 RepID=A0A423WFK8_9PEZI|nr:hypothetical protein VPNG_07695 [Cytospora leucostoma]
MIQNRVAQAVGSDVAEDATTEQTPLLASKDVAQTGDPAVSGSTTVQDSGSDAPAENGDASHQGDEDEDEDEDDKPLPKRQVILLCFSRIVEPLAFFSIFPYINQMAQDNGHLADADVGFYSGLVESLFSLTQASVMVFWGRAADRVGRKPVLVLSLVGVTIATSIFGLARTIWEMILYRSLAGVFAGTIVTLRTMLAEHSTSHTQAVAFSWFAFSGNIGLFIGPLLGGLLADPAHQYPGAFGNVKFFNDYPYALASFVVGLISLVAVFTSAFFVEETLKKDASSDDGVTKPKKDREGIMDLIKAPGVGMVLYVYGHVMMLAFAYTSIVNLFWFTPVELGGYGFSPFQISVMMAINGISQAIWLLLVFPLLQHRWGTNGVMRACGLAYPFFFAVCPVGNLLLKAGAATAFWAVFPPLLALGCGVSMSFTAIQLALNDVSPDPKVLGTLNALALTGTSVLRSFAPALFTSLFALGARTQLLWGYAIWALLFAMALGFTVVARYLPEPEKKISRSEPEGARR